MATRRQYGTTWWGAAWLNAIEHVDEANRLPRGKTYANTGRVESLELTAKPEIVALVAGSAYSPYEITIGMKPVSARDAGRLVDAVAADPDLVADLLDGSLPSGIAGICEDLGIELFPKTWRSMRIHCSCPDSARICKHVAAVFYIMADRIDMDPFFIFRFRGIDLKRELKDRGIDLNAAVTVKPLTPAALLARAAADLAVPEPAAESGVLPEAEAAAAEPAGSEETREAAALAVLRTLPYATLPDLSEVLTSLYPQKIALTSNPDCAAYVKKILARAAKFTTRTVRGGADVRVKLEESDENPVSAAAAAEWFVTDMLGADAPEALRGAAGELLLTLNTTKGGDPVFALTADGKTPKTLKKPASPELETVPVSLAALTRREAAVLRPEMECWREAAWVAAALIERGDVVPAVVESPDVKNPCPRIWWLPALRDPAVKTLLSGLARGIAPWAVGMTGKSALALTEGDPARTALLAVSTLTSGLIRAAVLGWSSFPDPADIFEAGVSACDVSQLDGRIDPRAGESLARALKPFALGDAYPWRPVLTVRASPKDEVRLNFGILGRDADVEKAAAAELAAPEEDEAPDMPPAPPLGVADPSAVPTDRPVLLKRLLKEKRFAPHRFAALSVLKTLSQGAPVLESIRTTRGKPAVLPMPELKAFLFETAPHLAMLGVTLMLPQSLKKILKPRLQASAGSGAGFAKSLLTKNAIADFDWEAAIGSRALSWNELLDLAKHPGEVVRFGDDFVYVDPAEIARIQRTLENPPAMTPLEKMRAVLMGEAGGTPVAVSDELKAGLARITEVKDVPPPAGLNAVLRPYQERGFSWLMKNVTLGLGALIADDMGLGKTLQVIAAVLELKNRGELAAKKVLVVLPTTLIANWTRELAKFAPALTVGVHHGADRRLPDPKDLPDVTLTSYGTLKRDYAALSALAWRLLVIDEAQAVKNPNTLQTASVKGLGADQVIAMTGTPVENRLMEYWSILSVVQPRLLGTQKNFADTFARPIEADHDERAAEAFRRLTAPFMLRRVKTDRSIISDLPEKNTIDRFTPMRLEQTSLYAHTLTDLLEKLESVEKSPEAGSMEARAARRGLVLRMITSLKQICNSPSQFEKTETELPDSGKGDAFLEIIDQCLTDGRKVLVFTQYREMGERLAAWLMNAKGVAAEFLHGGVPVKKRAEMVDRFQTERDARVLILSLKAGGTGLNLTAASAVIHYDLWWNPAVEAQATDRAFRIGQRRDVLVYRLVTAGTFEEKINEMLEQKRELADLTVATGESWIGDLPSAELRKIFALDA